VQLLVENTKAITLHVLASHAVAAVENAQQIGLRIAKAHASQIMSTQSGKAMDIVTTVHTFLLITVAMNVQLALRFT